MRNSYPTKVIPGNISCHLCAHLSYYLNAYKWIFLLFGEKLPNLKLGISLTSWGWFDLLMCCVEKGLMPSLGFSGWGRMNRELCPGWWKVSGSVHPALLQTIPSPVWITKGMVVITIKSDSSTMTKLFSLYHVIHT